MAKTPAAGRVKTRLARDIGPAEATRFYRTLLKRNLRVLGADPRWRTIVAVSPDRDMWSPLWPPHVDVVGQGRGDLGDRMGRLFKCLDPGPVVIVGSDIPGITPADIAAAFNRLGSHDAVLGPAPDGGYWLIGLKRLPNVPDPFRAVRWSSAHTMADTVASLAGCRIAYLRELADVDGVREYRTWRAYDV